ncbi:hypothetical protein SCFA_420037 [anaerobic digester metagenome]|uniref:Uncharacterized protein n=1 Tax=anaerobic digester metagenome TaxID=1263854 RepID=A0A485M205_9ZZZZ
MDSVIARPTMRVSMILPWALGLRPTASVAPDVALPIPAPAPIAPRPMQRPAAIREAATKIILDQSTYPAATPSVAKATLETANNINATETKVLDLLIAHSS